MNTKLKKTVYNNSMIDTGHVLETRYGIKSFKLLGRYYSTNKNRVYIYKYDDVSWGLTQHGLLWKLKQLLKGAVRKLK